MAWLSDDELAVLQRLTDTGLTAKEIAAQASTELGKPLTKNVVIGLWHRGRVLMGDAQRDRNARSRGAAKALRLRKHHPRKSRPFTNAKRTKRSTVPLVAMEVPTPTIDDLMIPAEQRRTFHELTRSTCKWPIGDPGTPEFFFCGGEAVDGKAYCAGHMRRAYRVPSNSADKLHAHLKFVQARRAAVASKYILEAAE